MLPLQHKSSSRRAPSQVRGHVWCFSHRDLSPLSTCLIINVLGVLTWPARLVNVLLISSFTRSELEIFIGSLSSLKYVWEQQGFVSWSRSAYSLTLIIHLGLYIQHVKISSAYKAQSDISHRLWVCFWPPDEFIDILVLPDLPLLEYIGWINDSLIHSLNWLVLSPFGGESSSSRFSRVFPLAVQQLEPSRFQLFKSSLRFTFWPDLESTSCWDQGIKALLSGANCSWQDLPSGHRWRPLWVREERLHVPCSEKENQELTQGSDPAVKVFEQQVEPCWA